MPEDLKNLDEDCPLDGGLRGASYLHLGSAAWLIETGSTMGYEIEATPLLRRDKYNRGKCPKKLG